jgi:hypothetical protein
VLILIKGQILPPLEQRFQAKLKGYDRNQLLKRARQSNTLRMEDYRKQAKSSEK